MKYDVKLNVLGKTATLLSIVIINFGCVTLTTSIQNTFDVLFISNTTNPIELMELQQRNTLHLTCLSWQL